MNQEQVRTLIKDQFNKLPVMHDADENDDFFDIGVSSLTVVQLQLAIEEVLKVELPTSELVRRPSIREWIELYLRALDSASQSGSPKREPAL